MPDGSVSTIELAGLLPTNEIKASPGARSMLYAGTFGAPVVSIEIGPGWLLATTTMIAPALNALVTFSVNEHAVPPTSDGPRRTSATAPVNVPAGMPPPSVHAARLAG
jgi:hypothetical protein